MKLRLVAIILLLSLLLFFGFKKVSSNKNKEQSTNIEQLSIIKYIPENNKLLFISNLDSFNIVNNNEKDKNPTNKDNFVLIKDSILDYLGIDLGNNKLEDIYNNELIISTFENNKKLEDDILIVFKIKPEKTIDDLLNLPNKIDQIDEIISINRENKINFLNYIYRTDDNYIIASSDKILIKKSIISSENFKKKKFQYEGELVGLENEKNILFTNKFLESKFFNKEIFAENNGDNIATTFKIKNKQLILKSYLLNNKKNIDIPTYEKLIKKENSNEDNPENLIFCDVKNFDKYLNPLINDFQLSFFEEFNQNNNQNILILNSNKDWLITFEKNNEDKFDLSSLNKLKDFNKYTLKQNEDIYSIYSKDILEEKDDVIKQLSFENIYSIESEGLQIISNNLIDGKEFEKISKKFFNLKSNKDQSAFLYSKVNIKDGNSNKIEYFSNLQDLNFLIKNILNLKSPFIEIAIQKSCKVKKKVVEKDEKEIALRKVLNFGHTFAHAYEASLGYSHKLNHGEAVILGMKTALSFSFKENMLSKSEYNLIINHIDNSGLPSSIKKYFSIRDLNKILSFMIKDKKNNSEKINLVLLKKIGKPIYNKQYSKKKLNLFLKKFLIN